MSHLKLESEIVHGASSEGPSAHRTRRAHRAKPRRARQRRVWRVLAMTIATFVGGGIVAVGPAWSDGELVTFDRYRITPDSVAVAKGETVTFLAAEPSSLIAAMHPLVVVAEDGTFRSPPLAPGESWRFIFDRTGRFPFHVEEHSGVGGVVIVE